MFNKRFFIIFFLIAFLPASISIMKSNLSLTFNNPWVNTVYAKEKPPKQRDDDRNKDLRKELKHVNNKLQSVRKELERLRHREQQLVKKKRDIKDRLKKKSRRR